MLKTNGHRDSFGSLKYHGAGINAASGAYASVSQSNNHMTGAMRNIFADDGDTISNLTSFPDGCRHPVSWMMPQKAGGLSARNSVNGSGTITNAEIWAVKLAEASLTGSGDLTAFGGLIVQLVAALTGSGNISSANVQAFLQMVASLSGSGTAAGPLTGLGDALAALTGSGTAAGSNATGTGALAADLTVTGTGLSTANVGQAVWAALAASNNTTGTMGEKLNDAGSGSNPWTEVIESGLTAAEIMRIILAVQAGKSDITGSTVTFRDVGDTKNRVSATMTGSERTTVTLDGA